MIPLHWMYFIIVIGVMLWIDLGLQRNAHAVSVREAAIWSVAWVTVSLLFNGWIYHAMGSDKALEFLAAYLIEKSLSVDNMFVFIVVFSFFSVSRQHQPRILKWGILSALVMRLLMIAAGVALIQHFHWVLYLFGAILIYTGIKMLTAGEKPVEPDKNPVLRVFRRMMPMTTKMEGGKFFIRDGRRRLGTPLLATLIVIEATDVVFAVDSIPAVIAISQDPFIIYTSNVFAILGLRALFFLLSGLLTMFRFLKVGISLILCFVGVKMLISDLYHVPILASLAIIGSILILSIVASWCVPAKQGEAPS